MADASLKIGVSGVRGIAGTALTPQIAASFAAAFGTYTGPRRIVVGSDPRPSREMVLPAVTAGLLSVGCTPVDLGIVPIPALQYRLREIGAGGGIGVTASHHPREWNALKFYGPDGMLLSANRFAELLDLYHQGIYPRVGADAIPEAESDPGAVETHQAAVLAFVDVDRIRNRRFTVAVDTCNGAAWEASPRFLKELGCRVVPLHTAAGEAFPRNPEPRAAHLADLCEAVRETGADIGFAQDVDADRLGVVDERGNPLGEEATLALAVRRMLQRTPGPVVINLSTSRGIEDLAAGAGVPVHRTPVGEAHVVERMTACGSPVGGEGNGGVIVPAANPGRDSFVAMALILESLAVDAIAAGMLAARVPRYPMIKETIPCRPRDAVLFLRLLRQVFRDEDLDVTDGVRVQWPDRWLHARASQTEPSLRLVAEARREEDARALAEMAAEYFRPGLGA